jgi:hypothetical protein
MKALMSRNGRGRSVIEGSGAVKAVLSRNGRVSEPGLREGTVPTVNPLIGRNRSLNFNDETT